MTLFNIRKPELSDHDAFIAAVKRSEALHHPWVTAPSTSDEFQELVKRTFSDNFESYFIFAENEAIAGVFNLSEIVRGCFQNAYLGFYAMAPFAGKGYMSAGIKLVLNDAFNRLQLHRIEANVQPGNINSLRLINANGFRKEGYSPKYLNINGQWCDHERWAITIEDWNKVESIHQEKISEKRISK